MVHKAEDYPHSGHRSYAEGRVTEMVDPRPVLEMLGGRGAYRRFVDQGVGEGHREDYYRVEDQRFLGSTGFAERLKKKVKEEDNSKPKRPLRVVFRKVARAVGVDPEVLGGADRAWEISKTRALVGYVLIRRLGYRPREVSLCLAGMLPR